MIRCGLLCIENANNCYNDIANITPNLLSEMSGIDEIVSVGGTKAAIY